MKKHFCRKAVITEEVLTKLEECFEGKVGKSLLTLVKAYLRDISIEDKELSLIYEYMFLPKQDKRSFGNNKTGNGYFKSKSVEVESELDSSLEEDSMKVIEEQPVKKKSKERYDEESDINLFLEKANKELEEKKKIKKQELEVLKEANEFEDDDTNDDDNDDDNTPPFDLDDDDINDDADDELNNRLNAAMANSKSKKKSVKLNDEDEEDNDGMTDDDDTTIKVSKTTMPKRVSFDEIIDKPKKKKIIITG